MKSQVSRDFRRGALGQIPKCFDILPADLGCGSSHANRRPRRSGGIEHWRRNAAHADATFLVIDGVASGADFLNVALESFLGIDGSASSAAQHRSTEELVKM